jgi:crotonobetainyl-CoA:carnitine CoA-transferase CaiB-like acyl-CoA transferase
MIQDIVHPRYGKMQVAGIPFKLRNVSDRIRHPAPIKGEHNRYVLRTVLDYSEDLMNRLEAEGVVIS